MPAEGFEGAEPCAVQSCVVCTPPTLAQTGFAPDPCVFKKSPEVPAVSFAKVLEPFA